MMEAEVEALRREVMELRAMVETMAAHGVAAGEQDGSDAPLPEYRPRFTAGPGMSVSDTPDEVRISMLGGGSDIRLPDTSQGGPDHGDSPYETNIVVVVDWKYDIEDKCFKVLYGRLKLVGGRLSVEVSNLAGAPWWTDDMTPHALRINPPFGGGGMEAVEENY